MKVQSDVVAALRRLWSDLGEFLARYDQGLQENYDRPCVGQSFGQVVPADRVLDVRGEQISGEDAVVMAHHASSTSPGGQPD